MGLLGQVVQFVKTRFGDVLQVEAGDYVIDSLVEGATGDVKEAQFVEVVIAPVALGNISHHTLRRLGHLRSQIVALNRGQLRGNLVDLNHQPPGQLPAFEILKAKPLVRHRTASSTRLLTYSSTLGFRAASH